MKETFIKNDSIKRGDYVQMILLFDSWDKKYVVQHLFKILIVRVMVFDRY